MFVLYWCVNYWDRDKREGFLYRNRDIGSSYQPEDRGSPIPED